MINLILILTVISFFACFNLQLNKKKTTNKVPRTSDGKFMRKVAIKSLGKVQGYIYLPAKPGRYY